MPDVVTGDRSVRWQTYVIALAITVALFATAFFLSSYFNDRRIADIRATQDDISSDILSIETQFDLLQERSCDGIAENTILPSSLSALGSKLSYMEAQGQWNDAEVLRLKRLYSLMEIKDYLLMKQIAQKCRLKPVFVLYFYSNKGDCKDCEAQGYVLTALAEKYPQLRIYSFDYNLEVSAIQSLIAIDDVAADLPALVINGKTYHGLHDITSIEKILPQLATLKTATTTTTRKK